MSSFLDKLKSGGGRAVDNNKPPDETGVVVRKIEKRFAYETFGQLGLRLNQDAEVTEVISGSLASAANIPTKFVIIEVNNERVSNANDFVNVADRSVLTLVIKLHSLEAVDHIIKEITREEQNHSSEEVRQLLKLEELAKNTPRYRFLNADHPLFYRYQERLRSQRISQARIRKTMEELQEQRRIETERALAEAAEQMRREAELAQQEQERAAAAAAAAAAASAAAPSTSAGEGGGVIHLLDNTEDNSLFNDPAPEQPALEAEGENAQTVDAPSKNNDSTVASSKNETPVPTHANSGVPTPPPQTDSAASNEKTDAGAPILAAELLALVGVTAPAAAADSSTAVSPPYKSAKVEVTNLPSDEYTLRNGEKVICALKRRTGPIPPPPPGRPPRARTPTKARK